MGIVQNTTIHVLKILALSVEKYKKCVLAPIVSPHIYL